MTTTDLTIVVATHNEGKLAEMRQILEECLGERAAGVRLVSAGSMNLPDPVEDGVTFEENSLLKARDVAERTGLPAVADDSGLIVDVMGGAPGILSARWCGRHGDDAANNALLLAQIEDIPDAKRTARFCCAAALVVPAAEADGNGRHRIAREIVRVRARRPARPYERRRRAAYQRRDDPRGEERHLPPRQGPARPDARAGRRPALSAQQEVGAGHQRHRNDRAQ